MFWFKQKENRENFTIPINGKDIQVMIYHENRKNARVSIGKKGIHIRLPNFMSKEQKIVQTRKFLIWAEEELLHKEVSGKQWIGYTNGRKIVLYDQTFLLRLKEIDGDKGKAVLDGNELLISIPNYLNGSKKDEACGEFLTKILRQLYQQKIEDKLHRFNEKYNFGVINKVRLKNNASNWGSCSSKGNINVSVRLLLAPEEEVDYVLLHELAHLKVPNHSPKFWRLVAEVCPSFKQNEQWLKQNGHLCKI